MSQPILPRRAVIAAAAGVSLLLPQALWHRAGQAQRSDRAALPDYRERGARDDRLALRRALATGRQVHLPAGGGSAPDGAYLIGSVGLETNLVGGADIVGDGIGRTIVRRPPGPDGFIFYVDSGSPNPARNLAGIRLAGMTLADDVARAGFAEHRHLAHLNGVTDLRIHGVEFKGFRGDGLYLGSGPALGMERHNRRVVIENCRFDGINRNNRNAISIIDGDGIEIRDCEFVNVTRPGRPPETRANQRAWNAGPFDINSGLSMPGAIDCEPNGDRFAILRNVLIERCRFVGGGGWAVSLLLSANNRLTVPHRNFAVRDCVIEGCRGALSVAGFTGQDALRNPNGYLIALERNRVSRCQAPFIVNGTRDLAMRSNFFSDCADAAELGYTDYNQGCEISDNEFVRIGTRSGNGMLIRFSDGVTMRGNRFVDCGRADGRSGRALYFLAGRISNFRLLDNRFESPTGRTTYAIGVAPNALDRRSAVASGNVFTFGGGRDFG